MQSYSSLVEELSVCLVGRVHHYGVGDLDQEGQYHHLRYQHQEQVEPHDHWDIKDRPSIANCNTDVNKDEIIFICEQINMKKREFWCPPLKANNFKALYSIICLQCLQTLQAR